MEESMARQDKNTLATIKVTAPSNNSGSERFESGMYWNPGARSESSRSRSRTVVLARYGNALRKLRQTLAELRLSRTPLVTAPARKKRSGSPSTSQKKAA
jgi:hypothetical protein